MRDNMIRNLKDVHAVASKMFKCGAKRIEEMHGKGYLGVKLIVGHKLNPAFDANANPNKSGLTPEERILEENRANPRVPDIRILWLRPGITVQELTSKYLLGIKKSLETKTPIIEKDATGIGMGMKEGKTDAELANEVVQGKTPGFEKTDWDDDTDEIGFDEPKQGEPEPEESEPINEESENNQDESEILEAIKTLNSNVETLSGDINSVNDSVTGLENRINMLEGKEPKKLGRPKKK